MLVHLWLNKHEPEKHYKQQNQCDFEGGYQNSSIDISTTMEKEINSGYVSAFGRVAKSPNNILSGDINAALEKEIDS
jgi:hypothetical protein